MKHILVINPAAGKTNSHPRILEEVEPLRASYDVEVYETKGKGDATAFVKRTLESLPDTPIRFYACGGDGTLKEVANGAVGFPHASVTCYPCGSGNDFVKYYGGAEVFSDINSLITANAEPIDLIRVGERYSVNVVNFGLDTNVCKVMERVRTTPIIGGKHAYTYGVFENTAHHAEWSFAKHYTLPPHPESAELFPPFCDWDKHSAATVKRFSPAGSF